MVIERLGVGSMLMKMENISKQYSKKGEFIIEDICIEIDKGETVGIFGISGGGKSTIGQIMAGIFPQSKGKIYFKDSEIKFPFKGESRRRIQILFQHPEVAFNPKMQLIDSMKEPFKFSNLPYEEERLIDYLQQYGIYREHIYRMPNELSGGELQRMALARAMLMEPELIILDEPTSMLDVISQAQVIKLLKEVQKKNKVAYLFISHDYELCREFCHRILPLECGKILTSLH